MALNIGEIVTEAEVEPGPGQQPAERSGANWEQRALLRFFGEQIHCDALRTEAFGNDD